MSETYIYIFGAYPGAYPLFKSICLRFAALGELNPVASRGRRYKLERPCRASIVAGKGFVLRWPAHTLRIPRSSNSDVLPALLPPASFRQMQESYSVMTLSGLHIREAGGASFCIQAVRGAYPPAHTHPIIRAL